MRNTQGDGRTDCRAHIFDPGPAIGLNFVLEAPLRRSYPAAGGGRLVTLHNAGTYITKLPKAEHTAPEWQAAMEALILVAELGEPTMFARIGMMRALNRHVERVFDTSRKDTHWGNVN